MNQSGFTVIKIFLASSINDTESERDKLQHKIEKTWNGIFKKHRIDLSVFRCEDMSAEYLKANQAIIDDEIRNSDIFVVLFKNSVGQYTYHEFTVAVESAKNMPGHPHVFPYISNSLMKLFNNDKDSYPELKEITKNDNYPKTFDNIDTVALSLLESIHHIYALDIRPTRDNRIFFDDVAEDFEISPTEINKAYLITQKRYIDFATEFVKKSYQDEGISVLKYFDQEFPDIILLADDAVRPFDRDSMDFLIADHSVLLKEPEQPMDSSEYMKIKSQYRLRNQNIISRYPFYDYMNQRVILSNSNTVQGFEFYAAPDEENVFSTLTLRDEFEALYENCFKNGKFTVDESDETLCPMRNKLRQRLGPGIPSLINGDGRYSACGIQTIVLFKVHDSRQKHDRRLGKYEGDYHYWTPMIRRANFVREQPGFYQFAPCETFRIFAEPEAATDYLTQEEQFSFRDAIFYNYVHGLFNKSEKSESQKLGSARYDIPEHASIESDYMDDPRAEELWAMLEDGRASMEFLGLSSSLLALKSDLVFLLVIDDDDYYIRHKKEFKADTKAANLHILPVEYLSTEEFLKGENCLAEEIVGPLELLKNSKMAGKIFRQESM